MNNLMGALDAMFMMLVAVAAAIAGSLVGARIGTALRNWRNR